MGLSCALPTSLSEVISTQLIKKKNDNNKAKGLKQRGPVITTTNNFPKETVKPTDDVRTENLGDGQTSHIILAATLSSNVLMPGMMHILNLVQVDDPYVP